MGIKLPIVFILLEGCSAVYSKGDRPQPSSSVRSAPVIIEDTKFIPKALTTGAQFGSSMAGDMDINGDNYVDIVISAFLNDKQTGSAFIYYGSVTGIIDSPQELTSSDGEATDWFGHRVDTLDIDSDGMDDIVVSSLTAGVKSSTNNGAIYILWLNDRAIK